MRKWFTIFSLLLLTSVSCFTVLNHPDIKKTDKPKNDKVDYYGYDTIYHLDDCTTCHTDYHEKSYFNPYYSEQVFYSGSSPNWRYYYSYPWWLNSAYYSENYKDDGESLSENRKNFNIRDLSTPSKYPQHLIIINESSSSTGNSNKPSKKVTTSEGRVIKKTDKATDKDSEKKDTKDNGKKRKHKKRK